METTNENGALKWLALGIGIIALEWMAGETLSTAFYRGMENPRYRPALIGAVVVTCAHLFDVVPDNYDVFNYLGKTKGFINGYARES